MERHCRSYFIIFGLGGRARLHQDKVWESRGGAGCMRDVCVPEEPLILPHPTPTFSAEYRKPTLGSLLADLQQFFTGKLYVLVYQLKLPAEELLWLALSWHVSAEVTASFQTINDAVSTDPGSDGSHFCCSPPPSSRELSEFGYSGAWLFFSGINKGYHTGSILTPCHIPGPVRVPCPYLGLEQYRSGILCSQPS